MTPTSLARSLPFPRTFGPNPVEYAVLFLGIVAGVLALVR
jgi:hypothetical protein